MRDQRLLDYYNRELRYLRALGTEFAESYPEVADQLRLEPNRAEDPHVERLLQGVAFLTARVHLRIDDDFPELSQALLNVVYPHYLRPTPAMAIGQFKPDVSSLTAVRSFPRGTRAISPPTTTGERFRFRTCYDTKLWPIEVRDAGWHSPHEVKSPVTTDSVAVLRIDLATSSSTTFDELDLSDLRFFLDGDSELIGTLYELVLNNCSQVVAWNPSLSAEGPILRLERDAVRDVGFDPDETMLPTSRRSFHPYQLLHDYFHFPQKFHFVEIAGLEEGKRALGEERLFGDSLQVLVFISAFERSERHAGLQEGVDRRTLRLSCTPVVNLYPLDARPIPLTHKKSEYPVSVSGHAEIFSVGKVTASVAGSTEVVPFAPFYSLRQGSGGGRFWFSRREPRDWSEDSPSDVFVSFVDMGGHTLHPGFHSVFVDTLCFDGDLPNEAMRAGMALHLEEEGMPIELLLAPTKAAQPPVDRIDRRTSQRRQGRGSPAPLRPPGGGRQHWRLVSMLSLNHLSLVEEGADAFKQMLRLHHPSSSTAKDRHIDGLLSVTSEPIHAPVRGEHGLSFARGRGVEMELDEEVFAGKGVYLFASVIEHFLGMYASVNSFVRLVVRTRQRVDPLKRWPPRSGLRPLL